MTIINQLLQFYLLICMKIQQSIFLIILEASTSIVCSAVWALTEKFRRPTNRLLQVALYFLLLISIVDSYYALFMRIFLGAQECAYLMGKILLGIDSSEIGMSTNTVPITPQLSLIGFFPIDNSFIFKDAGGQCQDQYRGTVGTFNNRNY